MKSFNKNFLMFCIPVLIIILFCIYFYIQYIHTQNRLKELEQQEQHWVENMKEKYKEQENIEPDYVSQYKDCKYLNKVENLQELLIQLMKSAYTDCLQKNNTKQLENIWGVNIFEVSHDNFYVQGHRSYGEQTERFQNELNKPYERPNDAYVVTRVYGKEYDRLYITANKDFLLKNKGLNQWIPRKLNNKYFWHENDVEFLDKKDLDKPLDLLQGFIKPLYLYSSGGKNVQIGFSSNTILNNYIEEIGVRIKKK